MPTVEALIPSIESVSFYDEGSTTMPDITVFHVGPLTPIDPGHYVSNIQLEINGTVIDWPQSSQSTETFIVHYSLGSNKDTYTVRARASSNLHGYSTQSGIVTVPESISIVLFIALTTFTVVLAKKTFGRRAST